MRDCMRAQTRRSSQLVTPASGATKTEDTTHADEHHGDGVDDFFRQTGEGAVLDQLVE